MIYQDSAFKPTMALNGQVRTPVTRCCHAKPLSTKTQLYAKKAGVPTRSNKFSKTYGTQQTTRVSSGGGGGFGLSAGTILQGISVLGNLFMAWKQYGLEKQKLENDYKKNYAEITLANTNLKARWNEINRRLNTKAALSSIMTNGDSMSRGEVEKIRNHFARGDTQLDSYGNSKQQTEGETLHTFDWKGGKPEALSYAQVGQKDGGDVSFLNRFRQQQPQQKTVNSSFAQQTQALKNAAAQTGSMSSVQAAANSAFAMNPYPQQSQSEIVMKQGPVVAMKKKASQSTAATMAGQEPEDPEKKKLKEARANLGTA